MVDPEDYVEWEDGEPQIDLQGYVDDGGNIEEFVIEVPKKDPPDWMTEMDVEILEVLGSELTLTPSIIAENIGRSREGVSQRLSTLQAGGYVDKVNRGKYAIRPEGMEIVTTGIRFFSKPWKEGNESE